MSNDTGFRPLGSRIPRRFTINSAAASIDLVAAVGDNRICIISMVLSASGAGVVIFNSGTNEIGRVEFKAADPPMVLSRNADSWLETVEGQKFNIGNAAGLTLSGFLTYIEI